MSSRISFSLNTNSIDKAIAKIEERQRRLEADCKELAARLAQYGGYIATIGFSGAVYEGKNDVQVTVVEESNGYTIHANGEAVCFIEFGTGVEATSPHGGQFGFTPGSWSKDHAQLFTNIGGWYYGGKFLTGTPANNCMYNANKEIERQIRAFAREVFGNGRH